jgi:hypothetical protein
MSTGTPAVWPARITASSEPFLGSRIIAGISNSGWQPRAAQRSANCRSLRAETSSTTSAGAGVVVRCAKTAASSDIPGTVSERIQFLIPALFPIQALALAIRYVLVVVQSRWAACLTRRMSAGRIRVLANSSPSVLSEISCPEVLEESEHREVRGHRSEHEALAGSLRLRAVDRARQHEIKSRRADHEGEKAPVPPAVEEVARQQQQILGPEPQPPVREAHADQKNDVDRGVERHVFSESA